VPVDTDTPLRCEECDRSWVDVLEPWRADWVDDEVGDRFWRPVCWLREFGGD
jgi:hypothetical protein